MAKGKRSNTIVLGLLLAMGAAAGQQSDSAPLPDARQLMNRAVEQQKATAAEQEKYLCNVHSSQTELDSKGKVKKTETIEEEEFFLNRQRIDRRLSKDGKQLSEDETKKEDERIQKEIKKYSDPGEVRKRDDEREKQIESALRILKTTNERRIVVNGRNTIFLDVAGDPNAQTTDVADRFLQAMDGEIALDEKTGRLVELRIQSDRDVKIGGGLVANVHKGAWLHVHQTAKPDGVWISDLMEGSGDVREALFLHPFYKFRQTTGPCKLFHVDSKQGESKVVGSPASP